MFSICILGRRRHVDASPREFCVNGLKKVKYIKV